MKQEILEKDLSKVDKDELSKRLSAVYRKSLSGKAEYIAIAYFKYPYDASITSPMGDTEVYRNGRYSGYLMQINDIARAVRLSRPEGWRNLSGVMVLSGDACDNHDDYERFREDVYVDWYDEDGTDDDDWEFEESDY